MPLSPYGPLPPPVARYRPFPFEFESTAATPRRKSPTHDLMSPITTPGSIGLRRRGRQATACTECNRRKQRCDGVQPCHHCSKRNVPEACRFPESSAPRPATAIQSLQSHHHPYFSPQSDSEKKRRLSDDQNMTPRPCLLPPIAPINMGRTLSSHSLQSQAMSVHSGRSVTTISPMPHQPSPQLDRSTAEDSQTDDAMRPSPSYRHAYRPWTRPHLPTPSSSFDGHDSRHAIPTYRRDQYFAVQQPLSSERHEIRTPPPPPHAQQGDSARRLSDDSETAANGWRPPQADGDVLMQEGGAQGFGSLAHEGAGEEHSRHVQFYGTSHFGPRLAASVVNGDGTTLLNGAEAQQLVYPSSECEVAPEALLEQIRHVDSQLPRRSLCERFVKAFFDLNNSWMDILYEPDFSAKYADLWRIRGEFEDLGRIDLRWLALFQVVLAFGALLSASTPEEEKEFGAMSLRFFDCARRALSEAPTYRGESMDTVRAYALLSLYLVSTRRVPEAWNTLGSAVRAAEAQGFHVDGQVWNLPPKEAELRRRLWAQLFILDRSISYFLGRPLAIQDASFTTRMPANITDDELSRRTNHPITVTTKSTFLILHFRLAQIIGIILTTCFGLTPRRHDSVMHCEYLLLEWEGALPPSFRFQNPDTSADAAFPWLAQQRQTLISKFHQARISLHRPYLLHPGFQQSRMACVLSAGAELRHRLSLLKNDDDPFDRFKWMTVASGFSPACVLGLLLARKQRDLEYNYKEIKKLFLSYLDAEKATQKRRDRHLRNELLVLDQMLRQSNEIDKFLQRTSPVKSESSLRQLADAQGEEEEEEEDDEGDKPLDSAGPDPLVSRAVSRAHSPYTHCSAQQPQQQHQEFSLPPPALPLSYPALTGDTPTLAPVFDEWPAPWALRPPSDPTATFPAANDKASWDRLLEIIGPPPEPEPWYDEQVVVAD